MPITRSSTSLLATLILALASLASTAPATSAAPVAQSVSTLHAKLRPSGDADGSGAATFRLDRTHRRVCASVTWKNIEAPKAAHIHKHSDGSVVVDLTGSVTGGKNCATGVSKRLIRKILDRPRAYYFNVHNATYPAGAIQGALYR